MPRNVAHSTKSCAARISTEPSITPCGGIAIPTAAKMIAAENDAIDIYFFIGIVFFNDNDNDNDNVGDSDNDNDNENDNDNVGDSDNENDNENDNDNVDDNDFFNVNVGDSVGDKPLAISL